MEHVLLAGFTHEPAIELAQKLVKVTPEGLNKVFYVDNGSSAIEAALKMSYHYHRNRGKQKPLFLSLTNSYHGETIANRQVPVPKDQSIQAAKEALAVLEKELETHGDQIAALIVEPLVQGAGSMHMYHPEYLTGARDLTVKYGVHLIADEIMTGFGRTGKMFACEHAQITPDFMTLSKGLTGGYLPLSVVMTTDEVYSAFYCDYNEYKAFLHSHSYTGNPLACSAALATLELFEKEDVIGNNEKKSRYILERAAKIAELSNVKEIRQQGMITAIELKGYSAEDRVGISVYKYALTQGVLLRPLGHIVYFMPPYTISYEEIDKMVDVAWEGIAKVKKKS